MQHAATSGRVSRSLVMFSVSIVVLGSCAATAAEAQHIERAKYGAIDDRLLEVHITPVLLELHWKNSWRSVPIDSVEDVRQFVARGVHAEMPRDKPNANDIVEGQIGVGASAPVFVRIVLRATRIRPNDAPR